MTNKQYCAKAYVLIDNVEHELVIFATDSDAFKRKVDDLRDELCDIYWSDDDFDYDYVEDTVLISESEIAGLQAQIEEQKHKLNWSGKH